MFGKMMRMDLKRGGTPVKLIGTILAISILMLVSVWNEMKTALQNQTFEVYGAIDLLEYQMAFDTYKVVMIILLASIHTGSICQDIRSRYQRMILCRGGLQSYVASRFCSNTILIIVTAVAACYLFSAAVMLLGFPVITQNARGGLLGAAYYVEWMFNAPYLYIGIVGLQFGMVAAAFSSIGLFFSAYQQDAFISIGISAFSFFIVISASAFWSGSPFDVLSLIGMQPTLPAGRDTPLYKMFIWGMMYPGMVISVCCLLFYRKMKERAVNGLI